MCLCFPLHKTPTIIACRIFEGIERCALLFFGKASIRRQPHGDRWGIFFSARVTRGTPPGLKNRPDFPDFS